MLHMLFTVYEGFDLGRADVLVPGFGAVGDPPFVDADACGPDLRGRPRPQDGAGVVGGERLFLLGREGPRALNGDLQVGLVNEGAGPGFGHTGVVISVAKATTVECRYKESHFKEKFSI